MPTVKDFKNVHGCWVLEFRKNGEKIHTRAGLLWRALLQRTSKEGVKQIACPTYVGCYSSFPDFQHFATWCQDQAGYASGFELDKDLLRKDNKEYGSGACVFLPQEVNKLLTKRARFRGECPIGVTKEGARFRAQCCFGGTSGRYLGIFKTVEEAFTTYKTHKEKYMKEVATKWQSQIDPRAFEALMNYEVLITD